MARPKSVNKIDETVITESEKIVDEKVKAAEPEKETTEVTEKAEKSDGYTVVSKKRANRSIVAVSGKAIQFNAEGIANGVSLNDAVYLKGIPDVEVKGL